MKYRFKFTKSAVVMLVTCTVLLALLDFAAGVITGVGLWAPTRAEIAVLKSRRMPGTLAAGKPGTSGAEIPGGQVAAPTVTPAVLVPNAAPSTPTQPAAAPAQTPNPPAAPQPARVDAILASLTMPQASPAAAPAAAGEYSLQLGSFLDPNNAHQLQADLKERGYTTYIFTATDADRKEWHVVRIDGFKTLVSASSTAAAFTEKERIQAMVRHSGAL
jgi:cell division septation protein DedD